MAASPEYFAEYYEKNKDRYKVARKEYYEQNKEAFWARSLRTKFGLTLEQYNDMVREQNGRCAICGNEETAMRAGVIKRLSVDHDHTTGQVRQLLCHACNLAIGHLQDSSVTALRAAEYLKRHGC